MVLMKSPLKSQITQNDMAAAQRARGVPWRIVLALCNAEMFLRPYYTDILAGIHSAAHEQGFHTRFIRFFNELKDPILYNQLIHGEEICGAALLSALDQSLKTPEYLQIIEGVRDWIDVPV
ncbi:MAG: hypothetical protein LBK73_07680 [Treponema sp.]|nr:hypothetical protein [Treponema sp.]